MLLKEMHKGGFSAVLGFFRLCFLRSRMSKEVFTAAAGLRGQHYWKTSPPATGPTWGCRKMSQIQRKLCQTGGPLRDTRVREEAP